jgi:transaldolase
MTGAAPVATENAVAGSDARQNPLVALVAEGQSVWLDYITRDLVRGGELKRLIEEDGLRGLTSNPTIFEKAIGAGDAYDAQIKGLVAQGKGALEIFETVAATDVREACDLFLPVYEETEGRDGFVSLEVSPLLARDTEGTIAEARRLWAAVDRPNLLIKVPGTAEGVPAIKTLLREGISVNVTLLFSLESHERVMWAYIEALEARAAAGEPIDRVASVASFFVSRVDTLIDNLIDQQGGEAGALKGKVAIANAKLAYANFQKIFTGDRFKALAAKGARVQRPLWASTGTKNKAYSDVLYVESLIGPDTVNTLPVATLDAFRDHGTVRRTIDEGLDEARATIAALAEAGIDLSAATHQLENEGVDLFAKSFADLLEGVERKRAALLEEQGGREEAGQVQTASEESFPASDPPAYTPVADAERGGPGSNGGA